MYKKHRIVYPFIPKMKRAGDPQLSKKPKKTKKQKLSHNLAFSSTYAGYNSNAPEIKDVSTGYSGTVASTGAPNNWPSGALIAPFWINPVLQGVGNNNRLGRKITMVSIDITWLTAWLTPGASTTNPNGHIQWRLVYDRQPNNNAAFFNITDYLTATDYTANINRNNADRFITLRRWFTGPLCTGAPGSGASPGSDSGTVHVKCKLDSLWSGNTAGAIDITTGGLYLLPCWSTGGTTPILSANFTIGFSTKVSFTDV